MRRTTTLGLVFVTTSALALSACGGGGFDKGSSSKQQSSGPAKLQILIGTSGDAETAAVKAAADAWSKKSGNTAEVVVASDLNQQLGQGFAGGTPPDVFYADAGRIGDFAKAGNLYAYGDQVKDAGFLDSLVKTYTYDGKLQCAPKDFSTLALVINTDLWTKAGLTDADIPKDWAGLEAVAKKLTSGKVTGLVLGNDINRSGAFIKQAGGWIVSPDGKTMTADSAPAKTGLAEVQKMMKEGILKFSSDTSPATGWGGEDHRGQLDQRRQEGLPEPQVQGRGAPRRPGRQGHPAVQQLLGHRRQVAEPGAGGRPGEVSHHDRPADGLRRRLRRHALHRGRGQGLRGRVPRVAGLRRRWAVRPGPGQPARLRRGDGQVQLRAGQHWQGRRPERVARGAAEERHGGARRLIPPCGVRPPPTRRADATPS